MQTGLLKQQKEMHLKMDYKMFCSAKLWENTVFTFSLWSQH